MAKVYFSILLQYTLLECRQWEAYSLIKSSLKNFLQSIKLIVQNIYRLFYLK
jgi:hypothetical protein